MVWGDPGVANLLTAATYRGSNFTPVAILPEATPREMRYPLRHHRGPPLQRQLGLADRLEFRPKSAHSCPVSLRYGLWVTQR